MNPISMKRGNYYWAIRCPNQQCKHDLAIAEVPARQPEEDQKLLMAELRGAVVRCWYCTQETPVHDHALIFLEAR